MDGGGTGYAVFFMRYRYGHDCGRVALFCLSGENETLAAEDHGDAESLVALAGPGTHAGGVGDGLSGQKLKRCTHFQITTTNCRRP